jgi:hypothetical protein
MNKKFCYNQGYNTGYDITNENISELNPDMFDDSMLDQFSSDMSECEC